VESLSYPRHGWRKPGSGESASGRSGVVSAVALWLSGAGGGGTGGWGEDGDPESSQATAASLCPTAGVNIGGAGSYIYEQPQIEGQTAPGPIEHPVKVEDRKVNAAPPKGPSKGEGQGGTGSLAPLPPPCSAGPEPRHLAMAWGAGCVRGVLCTHVSCLRRPSASHSHAPSPSSLQRHHLHRGAQHVPTLRQESLLR